MGLGRTNNHRRQKRALFAHPIAQGNGQQRAAPNQSCKPKGLANLNGCSGLLWLSCITTMAHTQRRGQDQHQCARQQGKRHAPRQARRGGQNHQEQERKRCKVRQERGPKAGQERLVHLPIAPSSLYDGHHGRDKPRKKASERQSPPMPKDAGRHMAQKIHGHHQYHHAPEGGKVQGSPGVDGPLGEQRQGNEG